LKRAKIYISDEGYGPIVRESAIVDEFHRRNSNLIFDVQTDRHYDFLKKVIPEANHIRKHNNINWMKNIDGSPDLDAIESFLCDYRTVSHDFITNHVLLPYDFVISDFVYEAFEIYKNKIPVFGVAHFTWDWFFTKLFPPVISDYKLIKNWIGAANKANLLFFPPFTPTEILTCYKKNAVIVPLIVRNRQVVFFEKNNNRPNILLIDSGSNLSYLFIRKLLSQFNQCRDYNFYLVNGSGLSDSDNVYYLSEDKLLSDYIPYMDLVIGRAGFNTISECISNRVPMLLFSEFNNPEMNENILNINGLGFGIFIQKSILENNLYQILDGLFCNDYPRLKNNLINHDFKSNGAEIIVDTILNYSSK